VTSMPASDSWICGFSHSFITLSLSCCGLDGP
jgi:hypothetical protein